MMKLSLLVLAAAAVGCHSYNYCSMSRQHVLCGSSLSPHCHGTSSQGLATGVASAQQNFIVNYHNELRAKVAKGNVRGQPKAANMRKLTWDSDLAATAQALANTCQMQHSCGRCDMMNFCTGMPHCHQIQGNRFYWPGQNLAMGYVQQKQISNDAWKKMIDMWFDEHSLMRSSLVSNYKFGMKWGHYSALVWGQTYKVGCGAVMFRDSPHDNSPFYKVLYVCNYGDGGNMPGDAVYKIGRACSACDNGCSDGTLCN